MEKRYKERGHVGQRFKLKTCQKTTGTDKAIAARMSQYFRRLVCLSMLDVSAYIREGWLINALTVCVSSALREGEGQLKEEQHCATASIIIITHHWTQSLNTHTQAVQP